jgi:antitoxin component YwqK of YwqJK toxin-antitoxin module|tara:strand:+ start:19 stop:438 length:420 start_codon:yes stop_codon:yes gene_type:complete
MKKLLFILLLTLPFIGFGQNEEKIEYWDNGHVLSQIHYLDVKRDGSCRHWYKNGQLMNEGFYKNGKMIGPWMSYHENGQIKSHGTYKYTESGVYSRKDGNWKYYYDNGQLERESIIKDGVEELKSYDKNGNLTPMGEGC